MRTTFSCSADDVNGQLVAEWPAPFLNSCLLRIAVRASTSAYTIKSKSILLASVPCQSAGCAVSLDCSRSSLHSNLRIESTIG